MMDLPLEIVAEILLQLPVKPLIQFKTVCKSWYHLITSTEFANRHLGRILTQPDPRRLRLVVSGRYLWSAEFDTFDNLTQLMSCRIVGLVGSCNGLLCLWISGFHKGFVLFNPTTRTCKTLPCLPEPVHFSGTYHFGFGYDSVSRDYKVVMAFGEEVGCLEGQVLVYSFQEDSWVKVSDDHDRFSSEKDAGVLLNESLHWVHDSIVENRPRFSIVCFSLNDHSFGEVPQPRHGAETCSLRVSVLEGCLCLSAGHSCYLDIWIMKEYGVVGSWTRLFCITKPFSVSFCWPVTYSLNRRKLFMLERGGNVVSLDVHTEEIIYVNLRLEPYLNTRTRTIGFCVTNFVLCLENLMMLKDTES